MTRRLASPPSPGPAATNDTVDETMQLIRRRGGRSTTARRVVLEALIRAGGELRTADQLAAEVQAHNPTVNESTVYRNLELLEELGLASHVHLGHGPSHWYVSHDHPRWYLTCTTCGNVIDTEPRAFDSLVEKVAGRTGFIIDSGHFAVTGTCVTCATVS